MPTRMPAHRPVDSCCTECEQPHAHAWLQALGTLALVVIVYLLLKRAGFSSLSANVEGVISLSAVFFIGLVAATSSCLAIVGGLLLSVSAQWHAAHPSLNKWNKLRPLLLFNAGRLLGYFVLGGLVGLLGSALTLSQQSTGILTIVLALVMMLLGLNILRLIPKQYCRIPLPHSLQQRIRTLSSSNHPTTAVFLGALTFFLPCGFTQSMQLLALSSGSFLAGGIIMLVFALGTLPSLLGISLLSALAQGRTSRIFLNVAGSIAILLGFLNLESGLLLTGIDARGIVTHTFTQRSTAQNATNDPYVSVDPQGRQIITVYVSDAGYKPASFTIDPGRETWVYAIAKQPVSGCANFITAPTYNLVTQVNVGGNWLGPIKNPQKDFVLTCSMGMLRADVRVKKS